MQLAKASEEEVQTLLHILNEITQLKKELAFSDFEDCDFSNYDILSTLERDSPEGFLKDLINELSVIHYERILWNTITLLDNCTDPNLDHLDFKPEIKKGLELLNALECPSCSFSLRLKGQSVNGKNVYTCDNCKASFVFTLVSE